MLYVFISVFCSVFVGVILKFVRKKEIDVRQIVLWNYPATIALTYILFNPELDGVNFVELPWKFYIPLSILLPTLFIFIAAAIKYAGLVKTEVAQRMSLFIPLIASFYLFHEQASLSKIFGICIGLIAVLCSVSWHKGKVSSKGSSLYPSLVFIGMGIIDILFKQVALFKVLPYTTSMFFIFCGAGMVATVVYFMMIRLGRMQFDQRSIVWGLFLGLFNFANIYFYMKAHRALPDNPSIVFTGMNVGVIILGSLIGMIIFKEKLSITNKVGLILAIISILLIAYL